MTIKPIVAWYDLWVGVFWDRKSRRLYILPIPCVGVVIDFRKDGAEELERIREIDLTDAEWAELAAACEKRKGGAE